MKKYISIVFLTLFVNLLMASVSLEIQNVDTGAGTLDIYMINDEPVGGFQFELLGITITGASTPDGFMVSTSSTTILAFSLTGATIPAGEGILTQVSFTSFNGESICFGEDTGSSGDTAISDGSGNYIAAEWGDCYCALAVDDCGVCGGNGICEGCDEGFVADCSGDGDCCPQNWIGDGNPDCIDQIYGCDLTCYDNDGGDCSGGGTTGGGTTGGSDPCDGVDCSSFCSNGIYWYNGTCTDSGNCDYDWYLCPNGCTPDATECN